MPQIREYTAQADALRPTETGVEAFAQAGRRAGAFYNQAGESEKAAAADTARAAQGVARAEEARFATYGADAKDVAQLVGQAEQAQAHQEVSHGAVGFAKATSDMTQQWNGIAANDKNLNDTSLQAKFMQGTFEPWAEQYLDAFNTPGGRDWAREHIDHLRQHLYEKTSADMTERAGLAVRTNIDEMARAWTNTARNDPSAVPFLLESAGKAIDGVIPSSPMLSGAAAAKARSETLDTVSKAIVKAGALSAIERSGDPDAARKAMAARYPQFVDAVEMDQLAKAEKFYRRINEGEARADRVQRDAAARKDFIGKYDALIASTMPQNVGDQSMLPKDYWDAARELSPHPGAEPSLVHNMLTTGEAITQRLARPEAPQSDPAVVDGLTRKLFDPQNPTTLADVVRNEGSLSDHDMKRLADSVKMLREELLQDPVFKDTMKGAQQLIEGTTAGEKMLAAGNYASFVQNFLPDYLKQKRGGTLPPNALDLGDPESLISKALAPYRSLTSQTLAPAIAAGGGVGAPPLPVYSAAKGGKPAAPPLPHITGKADYDKLAPGAVFIGPDGKAWVKPKTEPARLEPGQT